jgi:serine/threonine protein kinase
MHNRDLTSLSYLIAVLRPLISVLFCIFVTIILPRLKTTTGTALSLALLICYMLAIWSLYTLSEPGFETILPILILVVGYVIFVATRLSSGDQSQKTPLWHLILHRKKGVGQGNRVSSPVAQGPDSQAVLPEQDHPEFTLGNYRVFEEIGQDAMWTVFRGEDIKTCRQVAIKAVELSSLSKENQEEIKNRFLGTIKDLSLLTHPNIVTVEDWGEDQAMLYTVMEYLDGDSLDYYTQNGHLLPVRDTLNIIGCASYALDFAHKNNIIHQYIMPENIIITKKDKVIKITNFGFTQGSGAIKAGQDFFPGYSYYMSPEQIAGKKVDGRSDIFSLGVVLFEMLTGKKPFEGEDLATLMLMISRQRPPSPRCLNPKIPGVIEKIIYKALEKDREKRYQMAGQMAGHLDKVVARIDEIVALKKNALNNT